MQTYVEQVLTAIERAGGRAKWMYLDAKSNVRVGAGLLLPEIDEAEHLPFQLAGRAATRAEIAAEFHRVRALPPSLPKEFYRRENGPELEPEMIDALVRTSLVGVQVQLRASLPGFDELGIGTKMSLLDIGYRSGAAEAVSRYCQRNQAPKSVSERPPEDEATLLPTVAVRTLTVPRRAPDKGRHPLKNLGFGLLGLCASVLEWFLAT